MNTLAFVAQCRETTTELKKKHLPIERLAALQQTVKHLVANCTNPTLPSYDRLVNAAKARHLTV